MIPEASSASFTYCQQRERECACAVGSGDLERLLEAPVAFAGEDGHAGTCCVGRDDVEQAVLSGIAHRDLERLEAERDLSGAPKSRG